MFNKKQLSMITQTERTIFFKTNVEVWFNKMRRFKHVEPVYSILYDRLVKRNWFDTRWQQYIYISIKKYTERHNETEYTEQNIHNNKNICLSSSATIYNHSHVSVFVKPLNSSICLRFASSCSLKSLLYPVANMYTVCYDTIRYDIWYDMIYDMT
jgi:hypothetical protein